MSAPDMWCEAWGCAAKTGELLVKSLAFIEKDIAKEKAGWGAGMGLASGIERFGL